MTDIRLFQVRSVIDGFRTQWGICDHVHLRWFVWSRCAPVVLYEDVIPGYPHDRTRAINGSRWTHGGVDIDPWVYEKGAIDELFTAAEAEELRRYLLTFPKTTVTIEPCPLPLRPNVIGIGALAVGGNDDFYPLHRTPGYPLTLAVEGYYRLDLDDVIFHDGRPKDFYVHLGLDDGGRVVRFPNERHPVTHS